MPIALPDSDAVLSTSQNVRSRLNCLDKLALIRFVPVIAAAVMFVHAFALRYTPDDAYISFRYMLNLARGLGPVFNAGQQVEGYTSPLWIFLLGGLHAIGLPIESTALILSLAGGVLAVWLLPRLSHALGYELHGLDAFLLACNTSFAVWAGASMEMVVFAFVLVAAMLVLFAGKRRWLAGLIFATLVLVRPEGLLIGGLAVLYMAWPVLRREPRAWRAALTFTFAFAVPVLTHLIWRLAYYGYPLPNTFYVKVGFTLAQVIRGIGYVGEAGWQYLIPLVLPLLLGLLTRPLDRKRVYAEVVLVSYVAYVALVGGDWMVSNRLFVPIMPLITLFAAVGSVRLFKWVRPRLGTRRSLATALACAGVAAVLALDLAPSFTVNTHQDYTDSGKPIAEWLNAHCPTNLRVAVYAAGTLPYYAPNFPIVDMFGLADTTIAHLDIPTMGQGTWAGHEKFSVDAVMRQNPNIFVLDANATDKAIATMDDWRMVEPRQLTEQFLDRANFWSDHSIQTAPLPNGKHFNLIVLDPYPCS
ncbi:MAG: hypothetical protein WCF84_13435 [Anaerolineae bacterium]